MSRDITRQLKELKEQQSAPFQPSKTWIKNNKEQLFAQIQHTTVPENKQIKSKTKFTQWFQIFAPSQQVFALRGAFVFILVFGVATTGLFASASPLPRDIVFNVKVAVAAATRDTETKGKLHLEEASYQAKQLQQKLEEPSEDKEKQKKETGKQIQKIQKQLIAAQKNLEKVQEKSPEKATRVAKDLSVETTAIAGDLKKVTEKTKESTEDAELTKELVGVRKQVFKAGIDALEVLSEAIDQPEEKEKLEKDEVKEIETVLGEKVQEILQEAELLAKEVGEKKIVLEESLKVSITTTTPSSTVEIFASSSVDISSTTPVSSTIEQKSTSTSKNVQEELAALEQDANKTEEFAVHIKTLLEGNQVEKAVQVLKEITDITAHSEEKLLEVDKLIKETTTSPQQ